MDVNDRNHQEALGGSSRFRELGAEFGYGNGIDVLARAWAERPHMNLRSMGIWLEHKGKQLQEEARSHGQG